MVTRKVFSILLLSLALTHCGNAPDSPSKGRGANQSTGLEEAPRIFLSELIEEGAEWQSLVEGLIFTDGVAADSDGNVYFAEVYLNRIYKVDPEGAASIFEESSEMSMGLKIGSDGLLYACRNLAGQIVRYKQDGGYDVLLEGAVVPVPDDPDKPGEFCNDIAINAAGDIWFTDRINERVIYLAKDGSSRIVAEGFRPNGITLSLDEQMLVVTDSRQPQLHAFSIGADGALTPLPDFFDPVRMPASRQGEQPSDRVRPGTNGMAVDSEGRFYLTSFYGIQVFDRQGRYLGLLTYPKGLYFVSNVDFGGTDYHWLYASGRGGIVRIKMKSRGAGWAITEPTS